MQIVSPLLKHKTEPSWVNVPSVEDVLGDKLTAFAPETTGIPYYKNGDSKAMEIIKQLYDIGSLFDCAKDIGVTIEAFKRIVLVELGYRNPN